MLSEWFGVHLGRLSRTNATPTTQLSYVYDNRPLWSMSQLVYEDAGTQPVIKHKLPRGAGLLSAEPGEEEIAEYCLPPSLPVSKESATASSLGVEFIHMCATPSPVCAPIN